MAGQFDLPPGGGTGSDGNNVGVYLDDVGDEAVRESLLATGQGASLNSLNGLGYYDINTGAFVPTSTPTMTR